MARSHHLSSKFHLLRAGVGVFTGRGVALARMRRGIRTGLVRAVHVSVAFSLVLGASSLVENGTAVATSGPRGSLLSSGLSLSVTGPSQASAGQLIDIGYQIVNDGASAAARFAKGPAMYPAVSLSGLFAPGASASWASSSKGWTCTGAPIALPTCALDAPSLAPGAVAPPLIIRYLLAKGTLNGAVAPSNSTLMWSVVTAEGHSHSVVTATQTESLAIVPRTAGDLQISLGATTSSLVSPGKSVTFHVSHMTTKGFGSGMVDVLTIPAGLRSEAVNENGWRCPAGSGDVTCSFVGTVPAGGTSSFDVVIDSSTSTSNGVKVLRINSVGDNGALTAATAQPLFIISIGGPRLQIQRFLSSAATAPITNGASVAMVTGTPSPLSFAIQNVGDAALPRGATLTLQATLNPAVQSFLQTLPSQATDFSLLLPPPTPGGPSCQIDKTVGTLTCSIVVGAPIANGQATPRFNFSALVSALPTADQLLAVPLAIRELIQQGHLFTLTASVTGVADKIAPVTLDLKSLLQLPDLPNAQPDLRVPTLPLSGGPQLVTLTLINYGAATSGGAVATFVAPSGIVPSSVAGSACSAMGQIITCVLPDLVAGTPASPSVSAPLSFNLANKAATTDQSMAASLSLGGSPPLPGPPVPLHVDANPAVALVAPSSVQLTTLPTPGQLQVSFTPSIGAPAQQHYEATACLDAAMTLGCSQQNVSTNSLLTGLNPAATYYVTVTALASLNYTAATSFQVSATTSGSLDSSVSPHLARTPRVSLVGTRHGGLLQPHAATPPSTGVSFTSLCADATSAINASGSTLNENLGGAIAATLNGVSISGACSSNAIVSFTGGSLNLYGSYSATIGAGSVSSSGFSIASASLTTPSTWPGGSQTLSASSPLTLPFATSGSGDAATSSVSLQGSFTSSGLFGLPLPTNWSAQTTLNFSYSNAAASIGINSTAGPSGSGLTVSGSATTSGQFGVAVSGTLDLSGTTISGIDTSWSSGAPFTFAGTVTIGGSSLGVSGSYTDASNWSFQANGSVTLFGGTAVASGSVTKSSGTTSGSFTMSLGNLSVTSGMTVNSLVMTWTPGQGLTGTGSLSLGGTTLNLSGTYTDGNNWTFNANGSVTLFGGTAVASGSVTKSSGTTSGSFTMSLGNLSVTSGLALSNLVMTWTTANGLTGSGAIIIATAQINVNVTYSDSSNWSLSATSAGSGSVSVLPGLSVSGAGFTGSVSKNAGVLKFQMTVSLSDVTLISGLVTLQSPTFTIGNTCPTGIPASSCPSGNTTYLSATGTVQITLGNGLGTQSVSYSGVYGVQTGGFEINASLSSITVLPGVLQIGSPTFDLSYGQSKTVSTGTVGGLGNGTVNGYTLSIGGSVSLRLPGFSQSVPVTMTFTPVSGSYGFAVSADLATIGTLGPTGAQLADLVFTTNAQRLSLNGLSVNVPANSLVFGGTFVPPAWLTKYLGKSLSQVSLYAVYTSPTQYSVSGVFQVNLPIPTGTSNFQVSISSFSVSLAMSASGYTQSLSATGQLAISGSAGNALIDIVVGLSYQDASLSITGSLTASGTPGNNLWSNAFGLPGVNIQSFAISVGIELATTPIPLPSLGMAATITLSGSLVSALGITSGATIVAVVNMSVTNPCMDVQINAPNGQAAISIGGGLVTANYADLVLAPDGCTVGTYVVPAGFSFDFQGAFFGVALTVQARITITNDGFNLDASAAIGAFNVANAISFGGATVTLNLTPKSTAVGFAGSATILGVQVQMAGSAAMNPTNHTASMSLSASIGSFNVYGFGLQNVSFSAAFAQTSSNTTFSLAASAQMTVLGNVLKLPSISFSIANGAVASLLSNIPSNLNVGGLISINGTINLVALSSSSAFTLSASGTMSMAGFTYVIAPCANGAPGLSITTTGFSLCNGSFTEPMFTVSVSGAFYWAQPSSGTQITNANGQLVQANANDFYFSATNVSLGICGFGANGSVTMGDVGGTFFAQMSAGLSLSNTSSDQLIKVSGSFDSQGNFSLTGSGNATLAGIGFNLAVTAAVNGSNVAVTATTSLNIAGSGFTLSGSFSTVNGGVRTSMSLSSNLNLGGYNLGQGTITLLVQPGSESLSITDKMNLGGVFTASLNGYIGTANGAPVFNFNLAAGVNVPGIPVSGMLSMTNCSNSSCTATSGSLVVTLAGSFKDPSGASYNFGAVNVATNFSFAVNSSGSVNSCTGWTSLGFSRMQGCVSGNYNVTLTSYSPYLSFSAGFGASVSGQVWLISFSCSGRWYDPSSWRCSDTSHWGSTHSLATVNASIDSQGNVRAGFRGATFKFKI